MNLENAHALIIGVGGDLPQTVADANAIANILKDPLRACYLKKNVTLLVEKEATNKRILFELKNLSDNLEKTKDTTVIIYFSGHGIKYLDEKGNNNYYLCTNGFDLSNKENTMLKGDLFSSMINKMSSKRLLVMIDCCHASGMFSKLSVTIKGVRENLVTSNSELIKKLSSGNGRVFISSCKDNEQSAILSGSKISLFTQVALEAFSGQGSANEEYVRAIRFLTHILIEVPDRAKNVNHLQTPIINAAENLSSDYYLCKASVTKNKTLSYESMNEVKNRFKALLNLYNTTPSQKHFLHQFPKGPMVEGHMVNHKIVEAYARTIPQKKAITTIEKANGFRIEADIGDPETTIIELMDLLSPSETKPFDFWTSTFHEACLNGPRMLAALLYVVRDGQFNTEAKQAKKRLLEYLQYHN